MDRIRLKSECLSCIAGKQAEKYPKDCPEELQIQYKQRLYKLLSEVEVTKSAPMLLDEIVKLQQELFGQAESYIEIKRFYNKYVMQKLPAIEAEIEGAEDSLLRAIQYAMTGNYIDFGAMASVDNDKFEELLQKVGKIQLDASEYIKLRAELERADSLVYLTDNCGEIVFDQALIRLLKKTYPALQITVVVRGKEVLNDATRLDAEQIGLTKEVTVMDNGNGVAGTCLELLGETSKTVIEGADIIIAKGQGNFETLQECGLNIYYLFLCKCSMFAKRFGVERYTGLLLNDRRMNGI